MILQTLTGLFLAILGKSTQTIQCTGKNGVAKTGDLGKELIGQKAILEIILYSTLSADFAFSVVPLWMIFLYRG